MNKEKFEQIIDFAIEREKEAVAFYQDLQKKAKFTAQQEMLKELEEMEQGHIRVLNGILKEGKINEREQQVKDLQISDYIVTVEPSANMSYQDILIIAMKREEASKMLYTNMATALQDEALKNVFKRLASEEAGHKLKFEKLYDDEILKDN
jgi:rubrerythrin